MLIPVQCFTCGKVISDKQERFKELRREMPDGQALDKLNLHRVCCRQIMLTQPEILRRCLIYNNPELKVTILSNGSR